LLMLVVPAAMQISHLKHKATGNKMEVALNYGLLSTGVVMAVLGVYVSVLEQLGQL
jgi:putative effector of murein hydrolase LrgA (UPF0299 family)